MQQLKLSGHTYAQIGDRYHISRQRVQQLLSPPPETRNLVVAKFHGLCCDCGLFVGIRGSIHHEGDSMDTFNGAASLRLLCRACHRKLHARLEAGRGPLYLTCQQCHRQYARGTHAGQHAGLLYCSRKCYIEVLRHNQPGAIESVCYDCGKAFQEVKVRADRNNARGRKHAFCSQQCFQHWRHHDCGTPMVAAGNEVMGVVSQNHTGVQSYTGFNCTDH